MSGSVGRGKETGDGRGGGGACVGGRSTGGGVNYPKAKPVGHAARKRATGGGAGGLVLVEGAPEGGVNYPKAKPVGHACPPLFLSLYFAFFSTRSHHLVATPYPPLSCLFYFAVCVLSYSRAPHVTCHTPFLLSSFFFNVCVCFHVHIYHTPPFNSVVTVFVFGARVMFCPCLCEDRCGRR